jgi:tetratricopeptide (TPR) repeat protein
VKRLCRSLWLAIAALALGAAAAAVDLDQSLASLRAAAARHPDDPGYSWAVADALEAAGRPAEAADQIRAHLARWPDRPSDGWSALGRCEYRAGRLEPARDALRQALARDPRDAEAHLYLGLAFQRLGKAERAARHLEIAADLDPELAGDALLLAGVSHLSDGDALRGRELLERVIKMSPESASAREARSLIGGVAPPPRPSALGISASSGVSYDSNVTLGGEGDLPGAGAAEDDAVVDFATRVAWRVAPIDEVRPIEIGAGYDRSDYLDLDEFSMQRAGGDVGWTLPLHRDVALRLYGLGSYYWLDESPYLVRGAVAPSLYFALGGNRGALRVGASGEYLDYEEDPIFDSLERSGWEYGGAAEHVIPLSLFTERPKVWLSWGGGYARRDTGASRDELGFASAYDRDRWRGSMRLHVPLPFDVRADAALFYDAELYDHENVIDALSENPTSPDRRRDSVWSTNLSLRRKLFRGVDLEVLASFQDRESNVDLYAYQRTLAGVRLHAAFP